MCLTRWAIWASRMGGGYSFNHFIFTILFFIVNNKKTLPNIKRMWPCEMVCGPDCLYVLSNPFCKYYSDSLPGLNSIPASSMHLLNCYIQYSICLRNRIIENILPTGLSTLSVGWLLKIMIQILNIIITQKTQYHECRKKTSWNFC